MWQRSCARTHSPLALRELRGQVYARAEQAHGEGGLYVIAEEDRARRAASNPRAARAG